MAILSENNVEAELSYAYIHAVAAAARMECTYAGRHLDNSGVDATISARESFAPDSVLTDISLHIQLKATTGRMLADEKGRYSYFFRGIDRYNHLREGRAVPLRILVVLFLPGDAAEWLGWSPDRLVLQKCAFWANLVGAPDSTNDTGATVYLPQGNLFSPEGLRSVMTDISRMKLAPYER